MKKGCLLSILAIVLVVLLAVILLRGRIVEYGIKKFEKRIVQSLPQGYERAKVESLFGEFKVALQEKRVKKGEAREVLRSINEALKDKKLTHAEVDQILNKLRKAIER